MPEAPATRQLHTSASWSGGPFACECAGAAPIAVGAPGQFVQEIWTPETLLVAAAEGAVMLAFLEQARRCELQVRAYRSSAQAQVGPSPDGHARFRRLEIHPVVELARRGDAQAAERIFQTLPWGCAVEASLKSEVSILPRFILPAEP